MGTSKNVDDGINQMFNWKEDLRKELQAFGADVLACGEPIDITLIEGTYNIDDEMIGSIETCSGCFIINITMLLMNVLRFLKLLDLY